MLALRSLGPSGALTKALGTLDAAVLAALPRDAADEGPPPGSPLLHSDLLPELSRMLTAAGDHQRWSSVSSHCGLQSCILRVLQHAERVSRWKCMLSAHIRSI